MTQSAFAAALLAPDLPVPPGLVDPQGRPSRARFDVYRNNVTASLLRVLQAAFPVIERLVGAEFFAAMAVEFLRTHPPRSRMMMLYGAEFPAFLSRFPPVAHLGYLTDVARIEQALRESYHAADATPLTTERLAVLPPETLASARLAFAPSLRLIRSDWPALSIWQANQSAAGGPLGASGPEDLVILRQGYDPTPHALTPGMAGILAALACGQPVGLALEATRDEPDLTALLTLLLRHGAVTEIH